MGRRFAGTVAGAGSLPILRAPCLAFASLAAAPPRPRSSLACSSNGGEALDGQQRELAPGARGTGGGKGVAQLHGHRRGSSTGTGGADAGVDAGPVGGDRPVEIYVPSSYAPGTAVPLVLMLHG